MLNESSYSQNEKLNVLLDLGYYEMKIEIELTNKFDLAIEIIKRYSFLKELNLNETQISSIINIFEYSTNENLTKIKKYTLLELLLNKWENLFSLKEEKLL